MKVIDGHVVPNHVLFTSPTPKGTEYPTLANGDMLRVTISLSTQGEGPDKKSELPSYSGGKKGDCLPSYRDRKNLIVSNNYI